MKLVAKFGKISKPAPMGTTAAAKTPQAKPFDWRNVKPIETGVNGAIEWNKEEGIELTEAEKAALRKAYGKATVNMARAKNVKAGLLQGWTNSRMVLEYRRIPGHRYVSIATDAAVLRPLLQPVGEGQ